MALPQLTAQMGADHGQVAKRVGGRAALAHIVKAGVHRPHLFGVGKDVELFLAHRIKHLLRHGTRGDARLRHAHFHQAAADFLAGRERWRCAALAVAFAVDDAGGNQRRAQHRGVYLVGHQRQVVVQGFGQAHHRKLGRVVQAHGGCGLPACHGCGVDDVAAPGGVLARGVEHQRRKAAQAVGHAHQIDAADPLPIGLGVFPDQAARRHPGVVKQQCGRAKARTGRVGKRLHLGALGHVGHAGQCLGAQRGNFFFGARQGLGLDVGQHHVHARGCG